jgi:hypothetical protein
MEVYEGRWGRSEGHIGSMRVRRKSGWLLHFAAALPVCLVLTTTRVLTLKRHLSSSPAVQVRTHKRQGLHVPQSRSIELARMGADFAATLEA